MRGLAAKTFSRAQASPETAQIRQNLFGARMAQHLDCVIVPDEVDPVAFLQAEFPNDSRRQADSQGVAPFRNQHRDLDPY
jgi:hypothetical protein